MGNGANSRPQNSLVVQPIASQRHVPHNGQPPSGYSSSYPGYFANGGDAFGQRFQPQYGSQSYYTGDYGSRNGWAPQSSVSYGSTTNGYGYHGPTQDEHSSSNSRQMPPRRDRNDRNHQGTSHQSALSSHHHPKRARTNGRSVGHQTGYQNWQDGNKSSSSDEIVFEVFHCIKTGRDYSVINVDGVRYLVNSWDAGDELQPFPEDWYQHGYIESQQPVTADYVEYDEGSYGDGQQSDEGWVPRWEDDRMGVMEHPIRGLLNTYFEETKLNVLSVYDHVSGTWLKMPLSWELHVSDISSRVTAIQEAFPAWDDRFEILAMLRQCNYDLDEVTNTYITLLAEDMVKERPGTKQKSRSSSGHDHAAEVELLKERIEQLEGQLREKETELEESCSANEDLKGKLKSSEDMVRKLQIKGTSLQREIQQLKSAPEPAPQPVVQVVPSPKAPTINKETCRDIASTVRIFSQMLVEIRNCFTTEMDGIASVLDQAQSSLRKMNKLDQGSSKEVMELRALYHKEVMERKLLYNKLQELRGNIRVFCRCRYDPKGDSVFTFSTDQDLNLTSGTGQKKSFRFDRVFTPSSSQEEVFQDTLPLITSCVDGYNVCIMAYGQTAISIARGAAPIYENIRRRPKETMRVFTAGMPAKLNRVQLRRQRDSNFIPGAGKTYTMMGTDQDPGVNIRSILELLRVCEERTNVDYSMCVSMVEVYNETVRDLLSDNSSSQQLNIIMKSKQLVITDVTEVVVKSASDIKSIMQKGDMNRSVGATKMNTNSSRSHLLLLLKLQGTDRVTNAVTRGTLTLVDLAGSERISKTEATGQRLVEAAAINKSLSALGQVFAALRTNAMHVPYRNSKLTQLMQSSLGGDGKACLFVNVSPLASNLSETLSTLQFGSAAKQVQLGKATQNVTSAPKKN